MLSIILSILKNRLTNLKAAYKQASLEAKMQRVCPEIMKKNIEEEVLEIISTITKYPAEMLEKDMEMEADLGIDT